MSRSELVVATGTYDGGPSAPPARSSVADGGFMSSRVALRPVRAAQSDAAPPSYATRSAPTSATIVASRRGDSSTQAAARAAIEASVTDMTIAIDAQGEISGVLDFVVTTTADVNLGTNAILRDGVTGTFSYAYTGGTDWSGSWNFGGVTGIHIDLVRGSDILGTATGVLQPTGVLEATLVQGSTAISFTTYGVEWPAGLGFFSP